jgi:hypothetical protein
LRVATFLRTNGQPPEGKIKPTRTTYHSGDYDCTDGDEHNGPVCHTPLEWAELDSIAGTPERVDGLQIELDKKHQLTGLVIVEDKATEDPRCVQQDYEA